VIGKIFYKTDVRNAGSGNLGGTNAGRLLGKRVGISVIMLDAIKVIVAVGFIAIYIDPIVSIWAGVAAAFGHCYPVFANFRGGKAVATMFGFLFSIAIFTFQDPLVFLLPFACFVVSLLLSKMVSLSSIIAAIASSIYIITLTNYTSVQVASILLTFLLIHRHRDNIKRIIAGNEHKVGFLKKKKRS
ncbi:MAG: glycerol-3-phosphate 1-O-acyltransferase PlsY, partial [Breznakia sp.]